MRSNNVLVFIFMLLFQPSLAVLFTVEAEQTVYAAKFGGDVVMGCKFKPLMSDAGGALSVTWQWYTDATRAVDVFQLEGGEEMTASQDPRFRGRAQLLREGLRDGLVRLQISQLQIEDNGTYRCLVQMGDEADYKEMLLNLTAPYETVTKHIQRSAQGAEAVLTCRSQGLPEAAVEWRAPGGLRLRANTTSVLTPERLVRVTSEIRVKLSDSGNYTCTFGNDGSSATFVIPDEIPLPGVKNKAFIIASVIIAMVVVAIGVIAYRRQKGSGAPVPRGLTRIYSAVPCLTKMKEDVEHKPFFNTDNSQERLRVFLKDRYSDASFREKRGWDGDTASVESLTQRLQKNEDQRVSLQALIPDAGGKLLLEGPPGSGKTTTAHILVSSWTDGPSDGPANLLRLLVYVDCAAARGDLFEEITSQLSLGGDAPSGDELRTLLNRSNGSLLLLDGYREGCHVFDESLRRFLDDRGECRVLVMSCPGQCPALKEKFDTKELLSLQTQTVKY